MVPLIFIAWSLRPRIGTDARRPQPAIASLAGHEGDVAGGESDERHRLDADGGGDKLAFLAVGNRAAGVIEDLDMKELRVEMAALAGLAFAERGGQLGDPVSGENLRAPRGRNLLSQRRQGPVGIAHGFADANQFADGGLRQIATLLGGIGGDAL